MCRRKDLPSTEEVLAMGGSKQVMILALYAAEWTKPEFDKDILHVLKSQERKRTIYIKSLLKVRYPSLRLLTCGRWGKLSLLRVVLADLCCGASHAEWTVSCAKRTFAELLCILCAHCVTNAQREQA